MSEPESIEAAQQERERLAQEFRQLQEWLSTRHPTDKDGYVLHGYALEAKREEKRKRSAAVQARLSFLKAWVKEHRAALLPETVVGFPPPVLLLARCYARLVNLDDQDDLLEAIEAALSADLLELAVAGGLEQSGAGQR